MTEWNTETAEWYASAYGEYPTNRLAVAELELELELEPRFVILDVGCGTGSALRHAASCSPNARLVGVDPIPRMVEIARERAKAHPEGHRIEILEGPAEALPVEDAFADLVFAFDSIDHWHDLGRGLAEVRRVLRPGGRLVVVKDGGLPGGTKARQAFLDQLTRSAFQVTAERTLEEGEVSCTLWICMIQ